MWGRGLKLECGKGVGIGDGSPPMWGRGLKLRVQNKRNN